MDSERAERIHCVPLVCIRILPTTVIRVTPYFDLFIYALSGTFQGIVITFLHVHASH